MVLSLFFFAGVAFAKGEGELVGQFKLANHASNLGGIVMLYKKNAVFSFDPERYRSMPDHVSFFDKKGRLNMNKVRVPSGEYYLEAAVRIKVDAVGPPGENDYFYVHRDNGKPSVISIEPNNTFDLGIITQFIPFKSMFDKDKLIGCKGIIKDINGTPVSYAVVFAYSTANLNGRPISISEQSDSHGRYVLGVPKAGSYYLKVEEMKNSLKHRSGFYGDTEPEPLVLEPSKVKIGIDIMLN